MIAMNPIQAALKNVASNNSRLTALYDETLQTVLNYDEIKRFQAENPQLTTELIKHNITKLYEFVTEHQKYQNKERGLLPGYRPELSLNNGIIEVRYAATPEKIRADRERERRKRIRSLHMPKQILNASMENFETDTAQRVELLNAMFPLVRAIKDAGDTMVQGWFVYGSYGTGKSYVLGTIANMLADNDVETTMIYVPEFMREIKQAINDNSVGEKVQIAKETPVLMLDDIGAESLTSWTRDEVLGAILQYRMQEELPTFFSSNMDFKQLQKYLMVNNRGDEETMKATRIMERIRFLAQPIELSGKNYRQ